MQDVQDAITSWADVYDRRAELFDNPLDICEFYDGRGHMDFEWFAGVSQSIADALQLNHHDNVLEVGCGCGVLMKTLLGRSAEFTGVDPARKVLAKAAGAMPNASFFDASIDSLPFTNGTFHKAYCYSVMHYLGSFEIARRGILEMRRVMKEGGRILLGRIPNAEREADYQQHRSNRSFSRPQHISHDLKWLWYSPDFFRQFETTFSEVRVDTSSQGFDLHDQWRMDVILVV